MPHRIEHDGELELVEDPIVAAAVRAFGGVPAIVEETFLEREGDEDRLSRLRVYRDGVRCVTIRERYERLPNGILACDAFTIDAR